MTENRQCCRTAFVFLVLAGFLAVLLLALQLPARAVYTSTMDSYGEKIVYGYSGEGRELVAYKYGSGENVMVLGFEIHGYEDHFARDGSCLVYTAYQVIDYLKSSSLVDDHGWTVYVLPKMNPDGLESGTTCYGPGRCTTTCLDANGNVSYAHGIDMNRSFPTGFTVSYNPRNYTGPNALDCKESTALYNFVQSVQGSGSNILFDVHGWEQSTIVMDGKYGMINSIVSRYFTGNVWKSGYTSTAGGYLTTWAHAIGYTTCLLEMPAYYYSYNDYVNSDCSRNMVSVVQDLLQTTALVHRHTYETTVEDATCTAEGRKISVCSSCGDTVTETIPAKGHQWSLEETVTAPTATEDGTGIYRCSVCGAAKNDVVPRIFEDTESGAYYADAVEWAYGQGVIYGMTEHTFAPAYPLTRCMLVTMLYRMSGSPETAYQTIFDDVPDGKYYTAAVTWAYQNGIVAGVTETQFWPEQNITREQLAAILYRYAAWMELDNGERADLSGFADADAVSGYAQVPMQWCAANGIIYGKTATTLVPGAAADRAQATTMLYRLKNYLEQQNEKATEKEPPEDEPTAEQPEAGQEPQESEAAADARQNETEQPESVQPEEEPERPESSAEQGTESDEAAADESGSADVGHPDA